jgi:hypothetical protein
LREQFGGWAGVGGLDKRNKSAHAGREERNKSVGG